MSRISQFGRTYEELRIKVETLEAQLARTKLHWQDDPESDVPDVNAYYWVFARRSTSLSHPRVIAGCNVDSKRVLWAGPIPQPEKKQSQDFEESMGGREDVDVKCQSGKFPQGYGGDE